MHIDIGSVLSSFEAGNVNNDHKMPILGCKNTHRMGQNGVFFSKLGDLGGDFYKGIHEANMIGMHIGSVLSGLEAGTVNSDCKMPSYWSVNVCIGGVKTTFF